MAVFPIPYGRTFQHVEVPDKNLAGILQSDLHTLPRRGLQAGLIDHALNNPIGSPPLESLAQDKHNIVILSSDHTRPVPSHLTLPPMLARIRSTAPDAAITILVATGYHRASTHQELIEIFGKSIVDNERIVIHHAQDEHALVHMGTLPSGSPLWLNGLAAEADLLLADGFIEPHFFAGFSGGRKSVLPGIAGYHTVLGNHCSKFIASPFARTGNLDKNPIHKDMYFASEKAGLAFILNVVLNSKKEIIQAFAGHPGRAHSAGCDFLTSHCTVDKKKADIVITSNGGYPLDQNIYQSVKGMTTAEACCKEKGIIIMISACDDGHGGKSFFKALAETPSPAELLKIVMATPMEKTVPDQWEYQILARILTHHHVILVTDQCDPAIIEALHLGHALTGQRALEMAFDKMGQNAMVTVIPDGISVIVS